MSEKLLEVKNLKTSFFIESGEVEAVRGVTFRLNKGEVVGIVGESGSGKSVMAKSVMSLVMSPGKVKEGEILFHNENILSKSEKELRSIRGNQISLISQDPMSALNPVVKIGKQMMEVIIRHQKVKKKEAEQIAINLLKQVGLSSPEERVKQYPHEPSGGMKQRVMIAMAMSCNPDLLIADEPTTALDVTIQAQILDLMKNLKNETNMALLLITHDLGIVAQNCTRVIVMYGGLIMEEGPVLDIFQSPNHPYTKGLLNSLPKIANGVKRKTRSYSRCNAKLIKPAIARLPIRRALPACDGHLWKKNVRHILKSETKDVPCAG